MTFIDKRPQSGLGWFFHDLREGARRQGSVIFALIFREMKSAGDGDGIFSLLGMMFEPALQVAVMSSFWYSIGRSTIENVSVFVFLGVSFTTYAVYRRSVTSIPKAIKTARGFYAYPKVKPFDALLASFIVEAVITTLGGMMLIFVVWWFTGQGIIVSHLLEGAGIFLLMMVAAFGSALATAVYGLRFSIIAKLIQFSSHFMILFSAVIHPASEVPAEAQYYLAWNPLAHAMELMRWYLLGIKPFAGASVSFFAMFAMVCLFLGFICYYPNRQKVLKLD